MKHALKKTLLVAIVVALVFGGLGYYLGSRNNIVFYVNSKSSDTDRIPECQARQWITNYGYVAGKLAVQLQSKDNPFHLPIDSLTAGAGWTIPMTDIINIMDSLKLKGPKYARAYLALDTSSKVQSLHLILAIVENYGDPGNGAGNDVPLKYYFDLVRPCPNLCDNSSVLYKAYQRGVNSGTTDSLMPIVICK